MQENKGIFWLASYPKSGNTWFRIFLANLLNPSHQPIDLNHLHTGAIASARGWVDEALGFDSADLSHDELDALRPKVYAWLGEQSDGVRYHKIHDAYTYLENAEPLVPTAGCLGALYFIRNPLDVAISFAHHSNCSIDDSIERMGKPSFAFCKGRFRQHNQLRQWLLSWSLHVQSWAKAIHINCLVLRYEDMVSDPLATFTKAVEFLKIDASPSTIASAIHHARIETLQEMELKTGFSEKPAKVARFFRKGMVGDWKNTLSDEQVNQVLQDHGETMREYGYLEDGL